jgi:hypothetical protein
LVRLFVFSGSGRRASLLSRLQKIRDTFGSEIPAISGLFSFHPVAGPVAIPITPLPHYPAVNTPSGLNRATDRPSPDTSEKGTR